MYVYIFIYIYIYYAHNNLRSASRAAPSVTYNTNNDKRTINDDNNSLINHII